MKIWHKVLVAPLVSILFLLAFGGISHGVLTRQNAAMEQVARDGLARVEAVTTAARELGELHAGAYHLVARVADMSEEGEAQASARLAGRFERLQAALSARVGEGEQALTAQLSGYRRLVQDAIALAAVDASTGTLKMQQADTSFQDLSAGLGAIVQREQALAQERTSAAAQASRRAAALLAALLAAAVLCSVLAAVAISRRIVRPLQRAIETAGLIAAGDLRTVVSVAGKDETAQLLQALATMAGELRRLVGEVATGARALAETSAQIAQGNLDLSQRTEEQAGTLEESASSVEQLAAAVSSNARHAQDASGLAQGVADEVARSGQTVDEVVRTMDVISASSSRIANITAIIDGIAFQTNILALNAAVEAARAGAEGRGFAVVAAEVRNLAQRSAAAAREIRGLVDASVRDVDEGARLVQAAGQTIRQAVASVGRLNVLAGEIASSSREQALGVEQVTQALAQIGQVVQQNAALAEEATAATASLQAQAEALLASVARFRLEAADAGRPRQQPVLPSGALLPQDELGPALLLAPAA